MKKRRFLGLYSALVYCVFITNVSAQPAVMKPLPPAPEMKKLDFLIGSWKSVSKIYDKDGKIVRTVTSDDFGESSGYRLRSIMGGLYIESDPESEFARSWYFFHKPDKKFYQASIDFQGNFDILAGNFQGEKLVLTEIMAKPHRDGGTIMWRRTYHNIAKKSFNVLMEYSRDKGKTWVLSNKQTKTRN